MEVQIDARHHQCNEDEFVQALGVGDGQQSLACYSPWGRTELDMTERLNSTELSRELIIFYIFLQKTLNSKETLAFSSLLGVIVVHVPK